jgi:glucose/arabinose dehydrogenase/cytochrome c2
MTAGAMRVLLGLTLPLLMIAACSRKPADEVARGKALFETRCALCHATTAESAQGPGLAGVVGRLAASNPSFGGYTRELKQSGITWKPQELSHFLASPAEAVPGTSMAISVPDEGERDALVRYLTTLAGGPVVPIAPPPHVTQAKPAPPSLLTGPHAFGGYTDDGPGVRRHIREGDLKPPFETKSVRRGPRVAPRPEGFELSVPTGFSVQLYADGLDNPRLLRTAPNGDLFVSESDAGKVVVLRSLSPGEKPQVSTFATGLHRPFGLAFYPAGDPAWVYVANTDGVVRFPYKAGDTMARGASEVIVPSLTKTSGGHWTRDVAFSHDGSRMFVSVGSASNVAEHMPDAPPEGVAAWEKEHGVGASWGDEDGRADVRVMTPDGKGARAFATGIRNCVGMWVEPNDDLYCATNERDGLGDDLVPDYVTRVREGSYYGWPWYYLGAHEDPRKKGARPDLAGKATLPDVLLEAHSAALEPAMYGGAMFPPEYKGSLFVALHGSWNRRLRTGYKVVRVLLKDGVPTGEYEDFLTGFVIDEDYVWGRPVGVAVGRDGALYVSEDGNGTIWRVTYGAMK